eukprot:2410361-Rhodomonas_salina.1
MSALSSSQLRLELKEFQNEKKTARQNVPGEMGIFHKTKQNKTLTPSSKNVELPDQASRSTPIGRERIPPCVSRASGGEPDAGSITHAFSTEYQELFSFWRSKTDPSAPGTERSVQVRVAMSISNRSFSYLLTKNRRKNPCEWLSSNSEAVAEKGVSSKGPSSFRG